MATHLKHPVAGSELLAVAFAMAREAMYFHRLLRPDQSLPNPPTNAPCVIRFGRIATCSVVVLETGAGAAAAEHAINWLLKHAAFRPTAVVCAGFAGALQPGLTVGQLVHASQVTVPGGPSWTADWRNNLSIVGAIRGRLLTTPSLVREPTQKMQMGAAHSAVAVDMESAVIARHCAVRAVPWAVLRAISDDAGTALSPELLGLLDGGRPALGQVGSAVLRRPQLLSELLRLAKDTRRAARELSLGLRQLLTLPAKIEPSDRSAACNG